jgi:peptide chain release factor 1
MQKIPDIGPFRKRLEELDAAMAEPDFFSDARRAAELTREHQRIARVIERHEAYGQARRQLGENEALVRDESVEAELREMAEEELDELRASSEKAGAELLRAMIPPDPTDSRNTVVEIRAGAGGDEASLFAGDLLRMYTRYAEARGWRVEPISSSPSEAGGFKEVIFKITGEDVYKFLKFESGVHRVQRVPVTEASGRIHTSTATVAVLPEAEEVDIEVDPNDLDIQTMRASGAGGQHVNTTDSAVQIVHIPTGVTVYCADERSQHKNRNKAMTVLRSRLLQAKQEEEHAKYAAHRKGQIGTGDRSERIRTYNFPQGRLTDHRIGLSLSLPTVVEGELDELIGALQAADSEARVEALLASQETRAGSG